MRESDCKVSHRSQSMELSDVLAIAPIHDYRALHEDQWALIAALV